MEDRLNELPKGWAWAELNTISKDIYRYPTFYGMEHFNKGIPVIRGEHINKDGTISHDWDDYWFVSEEVSQKFPRTRVETDDLIMRFVLIIGNKGAGKSTFIDRFFKLILDPELRRKCLVIRIDLADSNGDSESIVAWLLERLQEKLESEMFKNNTPTYEELEGVFYREYQRWMFGEYKYLYQTDKNTFKIKFGEHIAKFVSDHPDKYVTYLLENAIKARGLMPCIIFDNTDHFPQQFQERVFLFAQSIHRNIFSFIICPITDRTIWQLSKEGPFQSYPTRSFYLPIPPTKEILSKRILFINQKLEEEKQEKGQYFLQRGIRLEISDIKAFATCIENILINTEYIARMVGWLSNHDIRRSLLISHRIVTSPFITLEDLVKTYISKQVCFVPQIQIKKALILGNYNHFSCKNSEFILNIFTVKPDQVTTPFIKPSLLRLLIDKDNQSQNLEDAYMKVEDIINYFEPAGLLRSYVKNHLQELLAFRLLLPYDPTDQEIYEEQRLRISHSGRIHHEFMLNDDSYVSYMALVTPVRSYETVADIREIMEAKLGKLEWLKLISMFVNYCINQDRLFVSLPKSPTYDSQSLLRHELRMKWIGSSSVEDMT